MRPATRALRHNYKSQSGNIETEVQIICAKKGD